MERHRDSKIPQGLRLPMVVRMVILFMYLLKLTTKPSAHCKPQFIKRNSVSVISNRRLNPFTTWQSAQRKTLFQTKISISSLKMKGSIHGSMMEEQCLEKRSAAMCNSGSSDHD